jgi:hypothetical protein
MSDVGRDRAIKMKYVKQIKEIKELQETTRAISCLEGKGGSRDRPETGCNPVDLIHRTQWASWTLPFCCGLFHDWETAICLVCRKRTARCHNGPLLKFNTGTFTSHYLELGTQNKLLVTKT